MNKILHLVQLWITLSLYPKGKSFIIKPLVLWYIKCLFFRFDFFLVSQCVNQGTVTPTNFNVIDFDRFGISPDKLQILTYKLCHMYFNWSGTIRVPAPCQYAHKLAFLTSQSLHRSAHPNLDTLLHFL